MHRRSNPLRISSNRFCLGLMLALCVVFTAGAQEGETEPPATTEPGEPDAPLAAPSRSKVQEQSLERLLPATQQRRLDIGEQAFLGLFLPAARPKPLGSIILIAGQDEHADWPILIGPARRQLSAQGWHTLAISLPERSVAEEDPEDAQRIASEKSFHDQTLARIQAARQVLTAEGGDTELPIVLLGRREGALWALTSATEEGSEPTAALILQELPQTSTGETGSIALLEQWTGPTYDILISPAEHAEARKLQAKRLGHEEYRQLVWPQSGDSELKQEMLIKRVGGWLKRTLSESPDSA